MTRLRMTCLAGLAALLLAASCSTYERTVLPFKMPSAYPNAVTVDGVSVASRAYDEANDAKQAFGFDIRGAGVLPLQVIFDNQGKHPLEIIPEKTLLIDVNGNLWQILDQSIAFDRISKQTEYGRVAPEAGKKGFLGGAAGALIGAAIGIVSGHNVGDAAMKGAAIGAAAGATVGGTEGLTDRDVQRQIREDLNKRSLDRRAVKAGEIAHGFVFFPGEAGKTKELRLRLKETDTGKEIPLTMKF